MWGRHSIKIKSIYKPNFQVEGAVKVVMSLTHGDTITVYEKISEQVLPVGTSSTVQILRKNHKVLLMINGVETTDRIGVNFTESKFCEVLIFLKFIDG